MTSNQWIHPILLNAVVISILGLLMIFSVSGDSIVQDDLALLSPGLHQAIYLALGIAAFLLAMRVPHWMLHTLRTIALPCCLVLLIAVLIPEIGTKRNGAWSWLDLGIVAIQPVELVKPATILLYASLLRHWIIAPPSTRGVLVLCAITALTAGLLLLQPDFSGAFIVLCIFGGMAFIAGLSWRWIIALVTVGSSALLLIAAMLPYGWNRITSVVDPWADPMGNGYQIIHAIIAVTRGGWFGNGIGSSVQKHLYLPEVHTDFLLAITIEEFGMIGFFVLTLLYILLLAQILLHARGAWQQQNFFGYLVGWGTFWMIASQTVIMVGVNLAVLPTTGMPLPLFSYGGNSLVTTFAALGIVASVTRHRPQQSPHTSDFYHRHAFRGSQ